MSETNKFTNPYKHVEATGKGRRHSMWVPNSDYTLLQHIRPGCGTLTAVSGTLWQQFVLALREQNINTYADIERFEEFVANLRVVDGRRFSNGTPGWPNAESSPSDVRRGAKGARRPSSGT